LREVFCPVLKFGEEKRTFTRVEGGNVDFFFSENTKCSFVSISQNNNGYNIKSIPRSSVTLGTLHAMTI